MKHYHIPDLIQYNPNYIYNMTPPIHLYSNVQTPNSYHRFFCTRCLKKTIYEYNNPNCHYCKVYNPNLNIKNKI